MYRDTIFDITSKLQAWRAKVINSLLTILAVAAFPVIVCVVIEEIRRPEEWLATLIFVAVYLLIAGLAFIRRLDLRLRAWGLVLLGYTAGSLAFARGGLAGDGRVYFLALPVLAMILVSLRSGIVLAILSILIYFFFAITAHLGWMADWLVTTDNPLRLINWVVGGLFFALALTTLVAIQWFFHQLQRDIITENIRLFEESERFRVFNENIVQSMDEGVFIEDTTGHITFVNPKAAELLDDSPENLIGRHWKTFVAPEHLAKVQEETEKRSQGTTSLYETVLLVRDKRIPVIVSARPLFENERFTGVLTVLTDVAELRRAEEALRQYTAQLEALRQVGLELTAQLDLDALLNSIVSHAHELMQGTSGGLYLYRPEQDVLEWSVSIGPDTVAPVGTTLRRGEGLSGKVWETGQPLIVDDYGKWKGKSSAWKQYPAASVVGAPVRWGDEFLGVLNVGARAPHSFSPADAELLNLFAAQAAIAIQNARLYKQAQHEIIERKQLEHRLAAVYALGQKLVLSKDTMDIAQSVVEASKQVLHLPLCGLFLVNEEQNMLVLCAHTAGVEIPPFPLDGERGITVAVVRSEEPIYLPDVSQDPRYVNAGPHARSELCVPLRAGDRIIGVLNAESDQLDAFSPADMQLLEALANAAAIAIQNARSYEQAQHEIAERRQAEEALQRRSSELALLHRSGQVFSSILDLDQVFVTILEETRLLLDAVACSIWLLDPATDELVCGQATDPQSELVRGWRLAPGTGVAGWVAHHGESIIVPDAQADTRYFEDVDQETKLGLRSIISVPLQVKQHVIGVLQVVDTEVDRFDNSDLELLEPLAASAAIAIENARLYEQAQQEIAERKRVEEALRESEEKYRNLVERANDGIVIIQDTTVKYVNPRLAEMWGGPGEEIVGSPFTEYIYPDELDKVVDRYRRRMAGESVVSVYETALRRKDGGKVHVELNAGVIIYEGELADLMIIRDITERKQMEEQLRQQERLATVGQLAGGIAHDFNNFLTTIILQAQVSMEESDLPPGVMRAFEIILGESQRAANLVQQILDFSRRSAMETHPVDLAFLVRDVIDVLQRTIQENIHFTSNAQSAELGEYMTEADPTRIRQALLNLATNARDAMPEGGELQIELTHIEVKSEEKPLLAKMDTGEWICLNVSDTGTGIPPNVLPHIFEPFFTTKELGKGTGLGLAQVYGIVAQHKGYIDVETTVGKGTTFRIYLPAYCAQETKVIPKEKSIVAYEGREETILLVEDEKRLREVGRDALESLGYRVLTAVNGKEALKIYRAAEQVMLVVTDMIMPEMGGKRLLQKLKQINPHVKVLAITGYAMQEDKKTLKELGFLDVVRKPFNTETLAQVIRQVLDVD